MDREIYFIQKVLSENDKPLSTREISAEIFRIFKLKISSKIVQNYLWSYFRNEIEFNNTDFTYSLKCQTIETDNVSIVFLETDVRAISTIVDGNKIKITYNKSVKLEELIKAIVMLNFNGYNNKYDLVKNINRYIDNL
jgi:hypothetical protein